MAQVPNTGKIALSLSGGGENGALIVGALQYLFEEGPQDILSRVRTVYGTSTGSLIATVLGNYIATGNIKYFTEMIDVYRGKGATSLKPFLMIPEALEEGVDNEVVAKLVNHLLTFFSIPEFEIGLGLSAVLGHKGAYSMAPLSELLSKFMKSRNWSTLVRAATRKTRPLEVGYCITSLRDRRSFILSTEDVDDIGILARGVIASCSQPVINPPIDVYGNGDEVYVDGGVAAVNPIMHIFDSPNYDEIDTVIAISAQPIDGKSYNYDKIPDILSATINTMLDSSTVYQFELARKRLEADGKTLIDIRPKIEYPSTLGFNSQTMSERVNDGFKMAQEQLLLD